MSPELQEALSRRYSNDVILILPLRNGLAVFNNARELCGFVDETENVWEAILGTWFPPRERVQVAKPKMDLEELGLI